MFWAYFAGRNDADDERYAEFFKPVDFRTGRPGLLGKPDSAGPPGYIDLAKRCVH